MASAEVCAEALRRLSVARDLTQADLGGPSKGPPGVEPFGRRARGNWPRLSTPCTAIATAMDLTAAGAAPRRPLALLDRAPARRTPMPHNARIELRLQAFEVFVTAALQGRLQALLAMRQAMAALWPHVTARRAHASARRRPAPEVSSASPPTMPDARRDA
jgi:hypothetical protein